MRFVPSTPQISIQTLPVAEAMARANAGAVTPKSKAHSVSHVMRRRNHSEKGKLSTYWRDEMWPIKIHKRLNSIRKYSTAWVVIG